MKAYDGITTKSYFRKGFNRVILVTFILVLIPIFLIALVQRVSQKSPSNEITAKKFITDTDKMIDEVTKLGGSAMSVSKDYQVRQLCGESMYGDSSFSKEKWTQFLVSLEKDTNYNYDVAYDEKDDSWLVIRLPRAVQFDFNFGVNKKSPQYKTTLVAFLLMCSTYVIALIAFVLFYGNRQAKKLTKEIEDIAKCAEEVEKGNYDLALQNGGTREIQSLKNAISHMVNEIQKKESIQKEEEAKRMLLVSEISHDLKNPLAGVQGYSEMLLDSRENDIEKKMDYANRIYNNSVRANMLLDSLFTYSKLGSSEYDPKLEKTDICEFTRQVVAEYIPRFEEKAFGYELNIPEEEMYTEINADLFRRVYDNLLDNSLKYNSGGTKITVKIEVDDYINVYVLDNGKGIDNEEVDRIFEPFVRGKQSDDTLKNAGSGLGLAIVKQIILLHNGTIEYLNNNEPGCKYLIKLTRKM